MSYQDDNEALVTAFLSWQRDQRGRSATTIADYARRLASLLDWIAPTALQDVPLPVFEAWTQRLRGGNAHGKVGSPASLAKDVAVVRSLYSYLEGHGLVTRNPSRGLHGPVVHNVSPRPVSEEAWVRLWNAPALPDEARVVLGLGFFVGLRRSEIASLQVRHVSPLTESLVGYVRKGGGQDVTPYGEMVGVFADFLPHLLHGGRESFLGPLHKMAAAHGGLLLALPTPDSVNARMRLWNRSVGLREYDVTPHMLRHGCATYLLKAGLPIEIVAELLNHSNIQVTRRYARLGAPAIAAWRKRQSSLL